MKQFENISEDGTLTEEAAKIVETTDIYIKYSPCGKGLHVYYVETDLALMGKLLYWCSLCY